MTFTINTNTKTTIQTEADEQGFFGNHGGAFIPEELKAAMNELKETYIEAKNDPKFQEELAYYLKE